MNINLYSDLKISNGLNDLTGPGIRTVLYVQGCIFNCHKCNLQQSHDILSGIPFDTEEISKKIISYRNNLTITGGEPLLQAKQCLDIVLRIKEKININIWLYTGFTFDELINSKNEDVINLLKNINILVDGQFVQNEKIPGITLKGSYNQRILDSKRSIDLKTPIIVTSYDKYNKYF